MNAGTATLRLATLDTLARSPSRAPWSAAVDLVRRWMYRADYRDQLRQLSERQRLDMGLDEASVAAEVRKPFWRA